MPTPHLPRNLLDEIEGALGETSTEVDRGRERLLALDELHTIGRRLSFQLGRPVTVFDVIDCAADNHERARRQALLRLLRTSHDTRVDRNPNQKEQPS
jgi:hypothetical protein